ncbi:MAG: tetratricopeptide repeat protein [Gammaproteobacteria bacterium]|nr:tetratricopeptide repeat protein [Gammaproteobacteria bacterium]
MAVIKSFAGMWLLLLLLLAGCATTGQPPSPAQPPPSTDRGESQQLESMPPPLDEAQRQALDTVLEVMRAAEWQTARELLQELIAASPGLAVAHANMGTIEWQLGHADKAEQTWLRALELRPGWAALYNRLGFFYREQARFEQALAMYQQALASDDTYARSHRNLAILYELYLGEGEKALPHYRRYLELVGGEEREVQLWIADLEQRVKRGRE